MRCTAAANATWPTGTRRGDTGFDLLPADAEQDRVRLPGDALFLLRRARVNARNENSILCRGVEPHRPLGQQPPTPTANSSPPPPKKSAAAIGKARHHDGRGRERRDTRGQSTIEAGYREAETWEGDLWQEVS